MAYRGRKGTQRTRKALAALVYKQQIREVIQIGSMVLIMGDRTTFVIHASYVIEERSIQVRSIRGSQPPAVRAKILLHSRLLRRQRGVA